MSRVESWLTALPIFLSNAAAAETEKEQSTTPTKETSKSDSKSISESDLLSLVKSLDALPSDSAAIQSTLQKLYTDTSLYDENGLLSLEAVTSAYLSILNLVQSAKYNKEQFKEAQKEVTSNGGLNEWAITTDGRVATKDASGAIRFLTPEQLYALGNKGKFFPLTNGELLEQRAKSLLYAGDGSILNIVSNGIGVEKVTKLIHDAIKNLGTDITGNESYDKTLKDGLAILQAAQAKASEEDIDISSVESLVHNNLISKSQLRLVQAALNYINLTLPINALTWLKLKSDGTAMGALNLVVQLVNAGTSTTIDWNQKLQNLKKRMGLSTDGSDGGSSPYGIILNDYLKTGPVGTWYLNGDAGPKRTINIQNGSHYALPIEVGLGSAVTKEGKSIGDAALSTIEESDFANIFDVSSMSMGNHIITDPDLVMMESGNLYSTYLPVTEENGKIKPDFDLLRQMKIADETVIKTGAKTPSEINAIYALMNLPVKYIDDGSDKKILDLRHYQRFGVLKGLTTAYAFDDIEAFIDDAEGNEQGTKLVNTVNQDTKQATVKHFIKVMENSKSDISDLDLKNSVIGDSLFGTYDDLYSGFIFLPVKEDATNALVYLNDLYANDLPSILRYEQMYRQERLLKEAQTRNLGAAISGEISGKPEFKLTITKDF